MTSTSQATASPQAAASKPGNASDYETMSYPSLPVAYCHPGALAATASLFNMSPVLVAGARVLELGCGSGGNLIPLAASLPGAHFVGVDLAEVQVRLANTRIAALGLKNITIHQADLKEVGFGAQEFDYILCHGVFSWVAKPIQDAIFALCKKHLSAAGVAVVSFNVLPGWHLRRVIRDICLMHAGTSGTPLERAARARQALIEITQGSKGNDLYTNLLRTELQRLQKMPAAYMVGEFLADTNSPVHFTEFYARAKQVGLSYLCDAEVAASLPEYVSSTSAPHIRAMSQGSAGAMQQYIDFFTGRQFRRAVLVREGQVSKEVDQIDPSRLHGLHFAAELVPDRKKESQDQPGFVDSKGRKVSATNAQSHALLSKLAAAFPSTLSLEELVAGSPVTPEREAGTLKTLLALIGRGQAAAFIAPLKVGRGATDRPTAWPLARLDAKALQPWVTSQHHRAVRKIPSLALILHLMDGTKSRADLQSVIEAAIQKGELKAPQRANGAAIPALSAVNELNAAIGYAARNGLLLA